MKNGECPKCKEEKPLTNHHVYPKRHYPGQFTNTCTQNAIIQDNLLTRSSC